MQFVLIVGWLAMLVLSFKGAEILLAKIGELD